MKQLNLANKLLLAAAIVLIAAASQFNSVQAADIQKDPASAPQLSIQEFRQTLSSSASDLPAGLYVSDAIAMPIVQQPAGQPGFVSNDPAVITQFGMANQFGTTGLLAHNHLAGAAFFNLEIGDFAQVVDGNGAIEYYRIATILEFQALEPNNPYSNFKASDGSIISANDLFLQTYASHEGSLILQTCILQNGDPSWGRLFIIAEPVTEQVLTALDQAGSVAAFSTFGLAD